MGASAFRSSGLNDFLSPALCGIATARTRAAETRMANARIDLARSIARRLRRGHQLPPGDSDERPLGDDVMAADRAGLLSLVADRLHPELDLLRDRLKPDASRGYSGWSDLRDVYGYNTPAWSARGQRPPSRVALRIGICLTAEVTFAPYMKGLFDAIAIQPAPLRIDLRSATSAISAWARADHPAVARCLEVARADADLSRTMGFWSFEELFRKILDRHPIVQAEAPTPSEINRLAKSLGDLVMNALAKPSSGEDMPRRMSPSILEAVAADYPEWIADEQDQDAMATFERAASKLVFQSLVGAELAPRNALQALEALTRQLGATDDSGSALGDDA